jgi:hypothetical protein
MRTRWPLVLGAVVALVATVALAAPDFVSMQVIPYEPLKPAPAFIIPGDQTDAATVLVCDMRLSR